MPLDADDVEELENIWGILSSAAAVSDADRPRRQKLWLRLDEMAKIGGDKEVSSRLKEWRKANAPADRR